MKREVLVIITTLSLGLGGLGASACAASSRDTAFDEDAGGDAAPPDPGSSGGLGTTDGGAETGAVVGTPLLYAHTDTTLFKVDPDTMGAMTAVGDFDCIGTGLAAKSMTDLAVSKDGKLYGVSEGAAFPLTLQGSTVHCEATWPLPTKKFYGLTFAPENTLGAQEVLIGADGLGGLYQIDETSGAPTQVGTLGKDTKTNSDWLLSGDIVFLANKGNPVGFATVRTATGSTSDTLIEVDVKAIKPGTQSVLKRVRGPVVRGSWCTDPASPQSFSSMYGIVAYKDIVYGFSRAGDIVEIHNADGTACLVSSDSTRKYAGAGITTIAPVVAPVN